LDISDREVLLATKFGKTGGGDDDVVDEFICDREEDLRRVKVVLLAACNIFLPGRNGRISLTDKERIGKISRLRKLTSSTGGVRLSSGPPTSLTSSCNLFLLSMPPEPSPSTKTIPVCFSIGG